MRTTPVDGVRSTLRNFRLGGLAERAKATPVLRTYYGDTKYQLGNIWFLNKIDVDIVKILKTISKTLYLIMLHHKCFEQFSCYFFYFILLGGVRSSSVDKSKPDKRSRSRSRPSSAKSEKSSKSESSDSAGLQPYNSVSSSEHERQYQPQSFAGLHIEDVLQENEELKVKVSYLHIDWLMQERRNSIANTLELRLSCTNPSILYTYNKYCPCLYPCQSVCLQNQGVFCG